MFQITYQLKNTQMRNIIDLTKYCYDIEYTIMSFPMLQLIEVTESDFTININASTAQIKNRVVRALGHKLATSSDLGRAVCSLTNSAEVIIAKTVIIPTEAYIC